MKTDQAPHTPEDVRAFFAAWLDRANAGDWESFARMMHPDIRLTDPMMAAPAHGLADALERAKGQYEPFPDGRAEMIGAPFVSVEEPALAYQWRFTGTHLRRIDPPGFAPTGRRVSVVGTSVLRFRDHLVVDAALFFDTTDVARQLLAAPPAGSPIERVIALVQRIRARLSRRVRT
jgi:predicted ester cyclase